MTFIVARVTAGARGRGIASAMARTRTIHAVRVAAYCGTMRDFQKLVVKRVMTAALADSVQHKREKVREKIKEKAGDAAARLNETRAAMRKKIFGAGQAS